MDIKNIDLGAVKIKEVWLVTSNTDLTEGRGHIVILHVCWSRTTAIRLAKGKGVQGSDANLDLSFAVKLDGIWLAKTFITGPSDNDRLTDRLDNEKEAALKKAKDAGLTAKDLEILRR